MDEMTLRGLLALVSVPVLGVPLGYLAELAAKGQISLTFSFPRIIIPRLATLRAFMRP